MKKPNYYLLEDVPQNEHTIEKIHHLFLTAETANLSLAFQLLQAGGLPAKLYTHIVILAKLHPEAPIRQEANQLFKKFIPDGLKEFIQLNWKNRYRKIFNEKVWKNVLDKLSAHPELDKEVFGKMVYRIQKRGVKFCLESPEIENEWILKEIMVSDMINLVDLGLMEMPEEIRLFKSLKHLMISGNKFVTVPDSIQELKNLETLEHYNTPLKKSEIEKLQRYFPHIYARAYFSKGKDYFYNEELKNAIQEFDKAIKTYPQHAEAWNWKGYCFNQAHAFPEAKACFLRSMELDDQNAFTWANLCEALCHLKEFDKTLETCEEAISRMPQFREKTTLDESNIWFIKGLANFWLKNYEQSIADNEVSIQIYNYSGAWYNKACSLSKLNRKEEMLKALEVAMTMEDEYVKMAEKDTDLDFDTFYEDEDFIALKNKYKNYHS